MYCERNKYIPFRINHNVISFNRGDAMECNTLKPQLNQNRTVNTDSYNKLAKREYEQLWQYRQSAFIDPNSDTYRREFIIQYRQTIPQHFWQNSTFKDLFNDKNDLSTFILLDESCEYGAPVGIVKQSESIFLNDCSIISWNDFKQSMYQNEIVKYQNLDFKGNNYLLTSDTIDDNFKPPVQQIANIELEKFKNSTILSYFIGQYVLLDFGTDKFMPIYIYTPKIIRSCQHIIILEDIERYIEYHPDTVFNKNEVIPNNCYANITVENVARPDAWSTTNITHDRPQLDNIPQSILNGMMTNDQSNVVSNKSCIRQTTV